MPRVLVSDDANYYLNKLLRVVVEKLGVTHPFSVVFAPKSNGTVERMS